MTFRILVLLFSAWCTTNNAFGTASYADDLVSFALNGENWEDDAVTTPEAGMVFRAINQREGLLCVVFRSIVAPGDIWDARQQQVYRLAITQKDKTEVIAWQIIANPLGEVFASHVKLADGSYGIYCAFLADGYFYQLRWHSTEDPVAFYRSLPTYLHELKRKKNLPDPSLAPGAIAEQPGPPKPRKRLSEESSGQEMLWHEGPSTTGIIHPVSERYFRTLRSKILSEYGEATKNYDDAPVVGSRYIVRFRINTETNKAQVIQLTGPMSDKRRAIFYEIVERCSVQLACPKELNERCGQWCVYEATFFVDK